MLQSIFSDLTCLLSQIFSYSAILATAAQTAPLRSARLDRMCCLVTATRRVATARGVVSAISPAVSASASPATLAPSASTRQSLVRVVHRNVNALFSGWMTSKLSFPPREDNSGLRGRTNTCTHENTEVLVGSKFKIYLTHQCCQVKKYQR